MNMETNPENPPTWNLPAELPNAFALPAEFRQSLPAEIKEWLDSVEKRIDGMTLDRIEGEAGQLAGEDNPEGERLYRLGRRIFYARLQQIADIIFPGQGVEVGIDMICRETLNEFPGGTVSDAINSGEGLEGYSESELKTVGF
jgi:hypothetical protein